MGLPAFDPYYGASSDLIKRLRQKGLTSGVKPLNETEIAAYRYGEVAAKSKEEMERLRLQKEIEFRNRELTLRGLGERRANRAAESTAQGQTVAGIATAVGLADKLGLGKALTYGYNKAVPWLQSVTGTGTYGYSPGLEWGGGWSEVGGYGGYEPTSWGGYEGIGPSWDTYGYIPGQLDFGQMDLGGIDWTLW